MFVNENIVNIYKKYYILCKKNVNKKSCQKYNKILSRFFLSNKNIYIKYKIKLIILI